MIQLVARNLSVAVIVLTVMTAPAWACVPQARLVTIAPRASGPPGADVRVNGVAFDEGRVELRWNSADGPLLSSMEGPNFSADVTIPKVEDGLYAIVVLSRAADGSIGNAGSAPFSVVGADNQRPERTTAVARTPGRQPGSDEGLSTSSAALAGATLLVVGGLAGLSLARRRYRAT